MWAVADRSVSPLGLCSKVSGKSVSVSFLACTEAAVDLPYAPPRDGPESKQFTCLASNRRGGCEWQLEAGSAGALAAANVAGLMMGLVYRVGWMGGVFL
jgi:hypothetical protein